MARSRSPSYTSSSSGQAPALWIWLGLAALVVALDQFAKITILGDFTFGEARPLNAFVEIVRWHNTGAAFSFLEQASGWQRWFFVGLAFAASAFIVWLLKRHSAQRLFCFALAMVLGGAVGNVIDRLWHGYVVDFIHVHHGSFSFPAFNLADSAITLGAICLILDELRRVRRG
jgi:signal peptidase II